MRVFFQKSNLSLQIVFFWSIKGLQIQNITAARSTIPLPRKPYALVSRITKKSLAVTVTQSSYPVLTGAVPI